VRKQSIHDYPFIVVVYDAALRNSSKLPVIIDHYTLN